MQEYKTIQFDSGKELVIYYDSDCESPREWDNLGKIIAFHKRYKIGDKHNYDIDEAYELERDKNIISLPLYMYDHSGISISVQPFGCPWDSGKIGFIYVDKDKIRKEYGVELVGKKTRAKVISALESEVKIYNKWLNGECYGFILFDSEGEQLDSCWGFIGDDFLDNGLFDYVTNLDKDEEKKLKEELKN